MLQRWVLRSGRYPPFSWLYRAIYRAAGVGLPWFWRMRFQVIASIHVQRGLTQPGWVPGASDIDLRIVIENCSVAEEIEFLRAFWRQYAAAKRVFAFFGEVQIINRREAGLVKIWGGARERPPAEEAAGQDWRRSWENLNEAIAACFFLLQNTYFSLDENSAADYGFKISKGYLDTSRYAAASRKSGPVPARRAWRETLERAGGNDSLAEPARLRGDQALDLCCRALQELEDACLQFIADAKNRGLLDDAPELPRSWTADLPNSELFVWQNRMKIFGQEAFPKVHGFYYEGMYRWLVTADVGDRPALKRLIQQLRLWPNQESAFRNSPTVASPAILQMLFWSSYLDTPLLYYSLCPNLNPHGMAARLRGRSPLLGWGQRAQWKMTASDFIPPSKAFLRLALGQSLSNLALSVRLFGLPGWAGNNAYRVGLLYSRLLSAHLFQEKGVIRDPDDIDGLVAAYEEHLPQYHAKIAGPLLEDMRTSADEFNALSAQDCFYRHYPAYRLILDRMLDRLAAPS